MKPVFLLILSVLASSLHASWARAENKPAVFQEVDGLLSIEAEGFYKQTNTEPRRWYLTHQDSTHAFPSDSDGPHFEDASGGAYLEVLPDTRHTHDDDLIDGENFSDDPGKMAQLHYKTHFTTPGRYYIWARIYSTNSEDDSLHVGIDGHWPETAMRWRSTINDRWGWSKHRRRLWSDPDHSSLIAYIDVEKPGFKELQVSMREDGCDLDKIVLTLHEDYTPEGHGPASTLRTEP